MRLNATRQTGREAERHRDRHTASQPICLPVRQEDKQ